MVAKNKFSVKGKGQTKWSVSAFNFKLLKLVSVPTERSAAIVMIAIHTCRQKSDIVVSNEQ